MSGFALLALDEPPMNRRDLAEILADTLNMALADVLQRLTVDWGILAERLRRDQALICRNDAREQGYRLALLPQGLLPELPTPSVVKRAVVREEGLEYQAPANQGFMAWKDILFVDLAQIQFAEKILYEDTELTGDDSPRVTPIKRRGIRTSNQTVLDLVTGEPLTWLRFSDERFDFTSTGLAVRPNGKQNLYQLAANVVRNSPVAELGPGLAWSRLGLPLHEQHLPSEAICQHRLRWRITLVLRRNDLEPELRM